MQRQRNSIADPSRQLPQAKPNPQAARLDDYLEEHPSCHSCECGDVVANLGGAFLVSWVWRF